MTKFSENLPCVWQDGALSVSSSHTWLHLDQRGRNKTSNRIGISLKIFCLNFFFNFLRFLRWKIFEIFDSKKTLKTWYLDTWAFIVFDQIHIFVFFRLKNDEIFIRNFSEKGDFAKNSFFTFVIIPNIPWRKNFFAFRAFVRSLPLETKLVLTRVGS